MSASQMRYVMISGRKSDVEFQGQQINQQRTTLATQSSACNTQLLNLKVPTPPSSSEFSVTTYTFNSNGQTRTIAGTQYKSAGYYIDAAGNVADGTPTAAQVAAGAKSYAGGTYVVNYTTTATTSQGKSSGSSTFTSTTAGTPPVTTYLTNEGTVLSRVPTNSSDPNYNSVDIANTNLITQDCNLTAGTTFYKYVSGGVTKYVSEADLAGNDNTTNAISTYYIDNNAQVTKSAQMGGATVQWNDSGRMTSITDAGKNVYSLTVTTKNDQAAYEDAYNEYQYEKALYDQQMENINSQICIIQSEDKKLELKLQDLDTQQQSLSTEMDAVKKVIDKNIEASFKTFA